MSYLFLDEDFIDFEKKLEENKERMEAALKRIGNSCKEASDTYHDNFGFEQAQRDAEMWSNRFRSLLSIRNNIEIVYPEDFLKDEVAIGRIVAIKDENSGEIKTFKIGSYMIVDEKKNSVSYDAPLSRLIMWAKVGDIREGKIGSKTRRFKIIKIE